MLKFNNSQKKQRICSVTCITIATFFFVLTMFSSLFAAQVKQAQTVFQSPEEAMGAFVKAIQADDMQIEQEVEETDVMQGIPADVSYIDPKNAIGEWLTRWWPTMKTDRNNLRGQRLQIHNLWSVSRHGDLDKFRVVQKQTIRTLLPGRIHRY